MNFYEVLGVDEDADPSEIRRAYRERARRYHPDVNDHPDASAQFKVLTRARDVLTDPEEREAYDRLGHATYLAERVEGSFPSPEMASRPEDRSYGTPSRSSSSREDAGDGDQEASTPRADTAPADGEAATAGESAEKTHSVPPTPGAAQAASSQSRPRGPERLRRDPTPETDPERGHFTASFRWPGVLAAGGIYAAGAGGYLRAHAAGLQQFASDLIAGPAAAGVLRGGRYGVSDPLTYAWNGGSSSTIALADGPLLLAGVVLLPVALAFAVAGLRSRTTWRPSWLHPIGGLGPAVAVGLASVTTVNPDAVPLSSVPLSVDLLLLVGLPAVVLAAFLVKRFLLVAPLRRREDVLAS